MSAQLFIQYLAWACYVLIFLVVLRKAIVRPWRANIDILLFFSAAVILIFLTIARNIGIIIASDALTELILALLLAFPYLLLRLLYDFARVPGWLLRAAELLLVALLVAAVFFRPINDYPWLVLTLLSYLIGFFLYTSVAFARAAQRSGGVTRRRMRAIATGSFMLVLAFSLSPLLRVLGVVPEISGLLNQITLLASGVSYFLGFAPPALLRRAWQEPELRAFLGRAASLPRLPTTREIVEELERGAASSMGAQGARIGLWDEQSQLLRFYRHDSQRDYVPSPEQPVGQAFLEQRPVFSPQVQASDPEYVRISKTFAVLAAPITAGEKRLGVLTAYAARAPIFADEDISLLQLLADQASVMLESRALIDEAASVRAREEATRLKDDFLSAAAHDLKSPLTVLISQGQLMERRAVRTPEAPADLNGLRVIIKEAQRLKLLVLELLDAHRAEQGKLIGKREEVDLTELAREVCLHRSAEHHPCLLSVNGPVVGCFDRGRIMQLLENLIENAIKYSPAGGAVELRVSREEQSAQLSVHDRGIGIPADDLPFIFDRFYRGSNVDDRRYAGMGLGLFICRGIVEQHGGQIHVRSNPEDGTTFVVTLPLADPGGDPHV